MQDGYAVIASDGLGVFPIIGEVRAGQGASLELQPGHVAYITTGAPIPPGADAVIQVEDTEAQSLEAGGLKCIRICKAATVGQDIRAVGSDIGSAFLQSFEVIENIHQGETLLLYLCVQTKRWTI